jgi:CRP-like cAMP-binding protein
MISPELLRRYAFFGGLSMEQIVFLADTASELSVEADHTFFHEEDVLDFCYLLLEGEVAILIELPEKNRDIVISSIKEGDMFGWSALLPPFVATAATRTEIACRVLAFDCRQIRQKFEEDHLFGYIMTQRIAQVMRDRLQGMRIESLAHNVEP